ncbi:MAG: sugar phosphate nucleotidyltransferase [Candidatus Hydrothermia bacterium]|nr:sugar phosphate nucleotidyltransferase [Candidatus Hydrothermia bacterium]MDD5572508.1 sugar phosphate nucleotidyltransferase [Candidatus Hydrothermia bacterium]
MKAMIPVGGKGTRLRPHTLTTPKPLITVAGKPILFHIIDRILPYKPEEVILVIPPDGENIFKAVKEGFPHIKVSYAVQEQPLGLGHAIRVGLDLVGDSELLIVLGDTIIDITLREEDFNNDFMGVKKVDNPSRYGLAVIDQDRNVLQVVEKPNHFVSDLAISGIYFFKNPSVLRDALNYIINNDIKTKGEYQLTDAIQYMLNSNYQPKAIYIEEWCDCGTVESLLSTNKYLLHKHSIIKEFPNALIIPPCYIGDGAEISNSLIGPYVSIGNDAKIFNSIIQNSIINERAEVENIIITSSIIGKDSYLKGSAKVVNLGDSSEMVES